MFKLGDLVKLSPKSKHGKDRIHQHGEIWRIIQLKLESKPPVIMLESLNDTFKIGDRKVKDGRWVNLDGTDPNFEILPTIEGERSHV